MENQITFQAVSDDAFGVMVTRQSQAFTVGWIQKRGMGFRNRWEWWIRDTGDFPLIIPSDGQRYHGATRTLPDAQKAVSNQFEKMAAAGKWRD